MVLTLTTPSVAMACCRMVDDVADCGGDCGGVKVVRTVISKFSDFRASVLSKEL